jgi:hypothetical protein
MYESVNCRKKVFQKFKLMKRGYAKVYFNSFDVLQLGCKLGWRIAH